MPTRDELATNAALQRLPRSIDALTTALEQLAPSGGGGLTRRELAIIQTALDQYRLHIEEERDAGEPEEHGPLTERLDEIDVALGKVIGEQAVRASAAKDRC